MFGLIFMQSNLHLMRQSSSLWRSEQSLEKQRTGHPRDLATRALATLASIEPGHVRPQQVAVLAAGSLLLCSWQFMSDRLSAFETQGIASLWCVWAVVAAALGLAQAAYWAFRKALRIGWFSSCNPLADQLTDAVASHECSSAQPVPRKEGFEDRAAQPPAACMSEDEDDVTIQKRRAQAEAAAQRAEYRNQLQLVLSGLGKSGKVADDAQALYRLADQLFESPVNVPELVEQGGVPIMIQAADRALQELRKEPCDSAALPLLLQVSWIWLQVAHGPPAYRAAIQSQAVAMLLLDAVRAVMAASTVQAGMSESILRNMCWCLLVLCDSSSRTTSSSSSSSSSSNSRPVASSCDKPASDMTTAAYVLMLHSAGTVGLLQQLVSLQHGPDPGWVAAATLGLFMQLGGQQLQQQIQQQPALHKQQQQHFHDLKAVSDDVMAAVLQPSSLHGLGYLLHHRPQLSGRLQGLVVGQLHYLITWRPSELLQLLIQEHLVGCFASGMVKKLGRLFVCQLLSSRGQEIMANIEEQYELDVALALAEVIPLPVHIKLSSRPAQPQQQQQQQLVEGQQQQVGEIEPADDEDGDGLHAADQHLPAPSAHQITAAGALGVDDDVYTDILACRLLLQHSRLHELLSAFWEELPGAEEEAVAHAAADAGAEPAICEQQLPPVCAAVLALVRHLMTRDLSLQAVPHMRGDSVDESLSSTSSGSCIDAALSMPDESGVYSAVLSGLVPPQDLPASRSSCCSAASEAAAVGPGSSHQQQHGSELLVLPQLPADGAASISQLEQQRMPAHAVSNGSQQMVVFRFGHLEHSVQQQMYKQIRQSSKLVHSLLSKSRVSQGCPVTVLETPHFTPEANCWVLQCLERWISTGELRGFSAAQACKLWVAADFLQVNGLQAACEDVMAASFAAVVSGCEVATALELCVRHTNSSSRLQRLVAQALMRSCSAADAEKSRAALLQLQSLKDPYQEVLLPAVQEEMRDRLVTLCMLNAGCDDDMPEEIVE